LKEEIEGRIRQQLMPALGGEGKNVEEIADAGETVPGDSGLADQ
jgi:hypothetical protein